MVTWVMVALGAVSGLTLLTYAVQVPVWLNMTVHTMVPLFVGCLNSRKLSNFYSAGTKSEGAEIKPLDANEALRFPVIASIVLLSLYVCIKYINPDVVNLLLTSYFVVIGIYCLKTFLYEMLVGRKLGAGEFRFYREVKLPKVLSSLPYMTEEPFAIELGRQDLIAYAIAAPVGILYFLTKYWVLTNVFGLAFSVHAIENMSLGSFRIGYGLLLGLLVYDVFFVFGTDVMLTVAKNIDAPIKLLFPKGGDEFSMIGLGDIILPGVFIALCIRFDLFRQNKKEMKDSYLYFATGLLGYLIGLLLTIGVMNFMMKEQPALLYLVPTCLLATMITSLVKNDTKLLWSYKED